MASDASTSFPGTRHTPGMAERFEASDLVVSYLEQIGVEYVFGVPGGAIEPLFSAMARSARRGGLRPVVARHESGAAFMASGYTRATGRLGVCCATTGPGATNLLTGVAWAFENEVPMLVITAQSALPNFGRGAFQESSCTGVNTIGMFRFCTRYNTMVSHASQIENKLVAAIQSAYHPTPGPAHLSVPLDVFHMLWPVDGPAYDLHALLAEPAFVDLGAVDELCRQVARARSTVLVIGGDCGEAIDSIMEFSAMRQIPFVTTPQGKGLVSATHPLNRGVFGFGGHLSATAALHEESAELILAAGTTFGEWTSAAWSDVLLNRRLVHIDAKEEHLAKSPIAHLHVRGQLTTVFAHLIEKCRATIPSASAAAPSLRPDVQPKAPLMLADLGRPLAIDPEPNYPLAEPQKWASDAVPIKPQRLMRELSRMFPPDTTFFADTGNSTAWATHYLHPRDRRSAVRRSGGSDRNRLGGRRRPKGGSMQTVMDFAPMGWAIGSAIGMALGRRGSPVVCITGDGSVLMNGQELTVAVAEELPIVFVVLNDRALGMVKHGQRLTGVERIGYALPEVDFCALARALGGEAHEVISVDDLRALDVDAMIRKRGPTLLDVHVDGEEVPPMGARAKVLEAAK